MTSRASREALFYERAGQGKVRCLLCPRRCILSSGQLGFCGVRRGGNGILETLTYGVVSGIQMDPVEKKPLYHFKPGSQVLSIGGVGCTLDCDFCQNSHLLDPSCPTTVVDTEAVIRAALSLESCSGIAFTYNEPTLYAEWILDLAEKAHQSGLAVILVTNGFMTSEAIEILAPVVDAMNIDLKSFDEMYYKTLCHGWLDPVKAVIKSAVRLTHVELTYLAVDPYNTELKSFESCVRWIEMLNSELPFHISRFFPHRRMEDPPTPHSVLYEMKAIADRHLRHVYVGNVAGADGHILCPACRSRQTQKPYSRLNLPEAAHCMNCGARLNLVL